MKIETIIVLVGLSVLSSLSADTINGSADVQGSDLKLGLNDGRDKGSLVSQRALVHLNGDILNINYAGDFEGGVLMTGAYGFNINPDPNIPYYFYPGATTNVNLFGSNYTLGVVNRVTSGRSGFIAYTGNDWINGAASNAHFLSLYPFDDSTSSDDGQWKAFRLRVGSVAEDRFWVNKFGEGFFKGRLDVSSTIRAKEVIVETNWSDYVFKSSYVLPSLSEVERHIAEFGHLPGVPSGESVESGGLSLGESQSILMAKIEELTLYLLEKDKQVDALVCDNLELRSRVDKLEANSK